jgi:hypothetical protein
MFRPFPIGLKPLESSADRFITHQALRDALLITRVSRQGQRPHARGFALEAWRLMQEMLEAITSRGLQHGLDGLRPIRLLCQALQAACVTGVDDVTNSWDRTAHKVRNGLRRPPLGTREDDVGPPDTEGICSASVGLQLETLRIGQGSDKHGWFHNPSIPTRAQLHNDSCGDALGTVVIADILPYRRTAL